MTTVFLGLGSNIDPEQNLKTASALLRTHWPNICFSSVYQSKAVGYEDQADFLNAVARIETNESPQEVRDVLLSIERELKKATPFKNGPRTIDLDLLLYGNQQLTMNNQQFIIPHPRMHERRFVLEPLVTLIQPDARHPVLKEAWASFLDRTADQVLTPTDIVL